MKKVLILTACIFIYFSSTHAESKEKNPFIPKLPKKVEPVKEVKKSTGRIQPKETAKKIDSQRKISDIAKPKIEENIQPPQLVITGLIWNSNRPQAIINNQVVDVGDEVESTKIVAIQKTGVDILFYGKTMTIYP